MGLRWIKILHRTKKSLLRRPIWIWRLLLSQHSSWPVSPLSKFCRCDIVNRCMEPSARDCFGVISLWVTLSVKEMSSASAARDQLWTGLHASILPCFHLSSLLIQPSALSFWCPHILQNGVYWHAKRKEIIVLYYNINFHKSLHVHVEELLFDICEIGLLISLSYRQIEGMCACGCCGWQACWQNPVK